MPEQGLYAEALYSRYHFGWSELYALTDARYRFIRAPRDELYDLAEDPGETVNRAADPGCTETVRQYRARLGEWFGRYVDPALDGAREPVTGRGQDRAALTRDARGR